MIEIKSFLRDFDALKDFSKTCEFKDETNPIDGVIYPLICMDIPQPILNDLYWHIGAVLHRGPKDPITFMRMSKKGTPVPHKFHTDNSMGKYSLMLYLDDNDQAGTGFAIHKELGIDSAPKNDIALKKTIDHCNDDSKWQLYSVAKMEENKAVMFDSSLFHVALPIGGFGKTQQDARIVLTCFFS